MAGSQARTTTTTGERVATATREAHLRVIVAALNEWAADPSSLAGLSAVTSRMRGYKEAAAAGLFEVTAGPAFSRHGTTLPPGEMQAALRMLDLTGRRTKAPQRK